MRLGYNLPQIGQAATPDNLVRASERAEALGYDSVWVTDRLLYPVAPQTPYGGTPDGSLPEAYKTVLAPVEALTWAAAHTSRIALGTSVLVMPYYNPVMLARRLTTLDVLSGGRLRAGFGQGWSKDEHDATGAAMKTRARRADEFLRVLKAIWTSDPAEFQGEFFTLPKSTIQPKPVQKPHPPIYLAAFSPGAMKRVATLADGWFPVGVPPEGMRQMLEGIRGMAKEAGRNPADIQLIVRANLVVSDAAMGEGRWIFSGSLDEIKGDIAAVKDIGADEVHFDPSFSPDGTSIDGFLKRMEQMRELAG